MSENPGGQDDSEVMEDNEDSIEPRLLSEEELLHKYWKLVVGHDIILHSVFLRFLQQSFLDQWKNVQTRF